MKHKRTHNCGQLRLTDHEKAVVISGWVENYRDHGGLAFIDLRDRWGLTQVVFDPEIAKEHHKIAHTLRSQDVVTICGQVRPRPQGMANDKLATGEIEVYVNDFEMLSKSQTPPFDIQHTDEVNEEVRYKYRYLDLRNARLQKNLITRSRLNQIIRAYFTENNFLEIETPILTKATPEGARDYLVPSRVSPGKFYALPQSPQLFKQSLMIAGFDRYIQIARCFRDEDLRAERQPEFTQIDVEMAFVDREDVIEITEGLMKRLFFEGLGLELQTPFQRLAFTEAMRDYGCDSPDLRFDLKIVDVSEIFTDTGFSVFKNALEKGGRVRSINLKNAAEKMSRKDLDDMTPFAKQFRAKGVAWIRFGAEGPQSPIIKFFSENEATSLYQKMGAETGDILIFVADREEVVCQALSELRLMAAKKLDLIDPKKLAFCWIVDFPLFEKDGNNRPSPVHHPFTSPKPEDTNKLANDCFAVGSNAYDIVLNGSEIGGGSIRIHDPEIQSQVFSLLGISPFEAQEKFGFLLDALKYGAPPHGGIALGLDRIIMLMLGATSIRDVIAFPKTQKAFCLMTEAPSQIPNEQLAELNIATLAEPKE